jgi:hypothetical protein
MDARFREADVGRVHRLCAMILIASFGLAVSPLVARADALPDGRAYELVTPPDTGSLTPAATAIGVQDGVDCFEFSLATSDGEGVVFSSESGALPGLASNGVLNLYEAHRSPSGWGVESKSATGVESTYPGGGLCLSPDHQYSTLMTGEAPTDLGSLALKGKPTSYIREPGGAYVLVGAGSVGTDQAANVRWISEGASHIIFTAKKRLEADAPVGVGTGTGYEQAVSPVNAVYDRTPQGLQVVSALPTGLPPNSATETTFYRGTSHDGGSVVFEVQKSDGSATIYEHHETEPTMQIASGAIAGEVRYAAISANGTKVTYIKQEPAGSPERPVRGSIYVFDPESQTTAPVTTGTESAIVNVSEDGSSIYFTSPQALPGAAQNAFGATAQNGEPNLYSWNGDTGATQFIATVSELDVDPELSFRDNLTEWLRVVAAPQPNQLDGSVDNPSRTTFNGSIFVFQSRANITGYGSGGHSEIYRFDNASGDLVCVSCPQEGAPATSDAALQRRNIQPIFGLTAINRIANVSDDGRVVFFMTGDPLSARDVNETADVYEWENGTVSLISSGRSPLPSLLYGMSASGRDVFFLTTDRLAPQDSSSILSIYDAREGGGFPVALPKPICEGDGCQGLPSPPLMGSVAGTGLFKGPADPKPKRHGRHHRRHKHRNHRSSRHRFARAHK